jgi:hypothetical protein
MKIKNNTEGSFLIYTWKQRKHAALRPQHLKWTRTQKNTINDEREKWHVTYYILALNIQR